MCLIIAIKQQARRGLRCQSRNIFEMSAAERTVLAAYLLCLFGCSSGHESGPTEIADHVFINGGVYTLNPAEPWAQAVAIVEKRVHMVGGNAEVEKLIGPQTVVIDLKNRMLMPSFGDSHIHLLYGGDSISRCDLNYVEESAEIRRILLQCAETLNVSEGDWLIATDWARAAFPEGSPPPEFLNHLFPNLPVVVKSSDVHSIWVNQVVLDIVGIDENSEDPENGKIERHPITGKPTGLLHERAIQLVEFAEPSSSREERLRYILKATKRALEFGITSAIEPGLNLEQAELFKELDQLGELNMRVLAALTPLGLTLGSFDENVYLTLSKRPDLETPNFKPNSVKVFVDGVIDNGTAPLLAPYLQNSIVPLNTFYSVEELTDFFIAFDKTGISIHVHAIGDLGIRKTLDAFAAMRKTNGRSDRRHVMTHLQLVDKKDLERFAELHIIASFSTLWAYPESYNLTIYPRLIGFERVNRFYPIASIMESGARIVIGSDWPITDMNPFPAIEVAITRKDPYSNQGPAHNPSQRIDLASVLKAYTLNVAYAMGLENELGSIEVGKLADLAVLDRNLFQIPVSQISDTQIQLTMFNGDVVFER